MGANMIKIFSTLFSAKLYKPSLGKIARRLTFMGLAIIFAAAGWVTNQQNLYHSNGTSAIVGALIFFVGLWLSFRMVNYPSFADFLTSVEAEMRKVSWPGKKEIFQTTRVVLVFMALFIVLIFIYDVFFQYLRVGLDMFLKFVGIVGG